MKNLALAIFLFSCSPALTVEGDYDLTCATGVDVEKSGDPLSFGRYAGGYGRTRAELLDGMYCSAARWRAATCLDVDLSIDPETWVRWLAHELMPNGASGRAEGPFNDARIKINASIAPHSVCPVMTHEMGHILRRNYGHPGPDYSMSFPVTHVGDPQSRITQEDIDGVCDTLSCGCQNPE